MAGASAAAMATGLRPILSALRARHVRSDRFQAKACGNGSMRTARSSGLGGRISTKIQRMWRRSTAKNMSLTAAGRMRDTPDRKRRSAATITAWRKAQEPKDRRTRESSNSDQERIPRQRRASLQLGAPSKKNATGTCRMRDRSGGAPASLPPGMALCCNRLAPMRLGLTFQKVQKYEKGPKRQL